MKTIRICRRQSSRGSSHTLVRITANLRCEVLLDHNLPFKLRAALSALSVHELVTASYMGWQELKNGELLKAAEENGFEVFVTGDRGLPYQQNLAGRRLAIVALSANNWPIIKNHLASILAAIESVAVGSCQPVDCGAFSRKFPPGE